MNDSFQKCPKCLEILPLETFHLDRTKRNGRRNLCKSCHNVHNTVNKRRQRAGMSRPRVEHTKLQAIVDLLSDSEWHTTSEIRVIGGMSYASRLSDLRSKLGLTVTKRRDYGATHGWMYRLITDPSETPPTNDGPPRERLLDLLRDGRWHSNEELFDLMDVTYQDHLYFLRKEGFVISKQRDPETGVWHYKMEI